VLNISTFTPPPPIPPWSGILGFFGPIFIAGKNFLTRKKFSGSLKFNGRGG